MIWNICTALGILTLVGFLSIIGIALYLLRWPIWWEIENLWRKK